MFCDLGPGAKPFIRGEDRPDVCRPGVAHPPFGRGEGERERDIGGVCEGVVYGGVPGMAGSGCAEAPAQRPEVTPELPPAACV